MGRRMREDQGQDQQHQDQDQEHDSEDELCHRLASMQCLSGHHYECGDCGQVHTGSHHWERVRKDQGLGSRPVYTWVCEHCTRVWNMRQWDPWLKVPEQEPPSTSPAAAAASSSSQWLAAGSQTPSQRLQGGIDIPIPEDNDDELMADASDDKPKPDDKPDDGKPKPDDNNSKDDKPQQ